MYNVLIEMRLKDHQGHPSTLANIRKGIPSTQNFMALRPYFVFFQETFNVSMYQQLHRKLQEATAGLAPPQIQALELPAYDMAWAETKIKKAALKLEKLDTDLKNYKVRSFFSHFLNIHTT